MGFTAHQESQRRAIIGSMMALMQDLQHLAPHPDQPQNKGPLFIKSNPNFKIANDHDGMLGSVMMESFLGTAFAEAVSDTFGSWTQELDFDAMLECYDEYMTNVEEKDQQKIAAHGQGTLARLSGKTISSSFNIRGAMDSKMQSFMNDMPKRMKIESDLSYYAKQLERIEAQSPQSETPRPNVAA